MKLPLYVKFLKYYLPLLAMFLILSLFLMLRMYRIAEATATQQNLHTLESARTAIDEVLQTVFNDVYALKSDPVVIKYKYVVDPFDGPATIQTMLFQQHLDRYFFEADFVYDSYLLFPASGYAVNSSVICTFEDLEKYYIDYTDFEAGYLIDTVIRNAAPFGYLRSCEINASPERSAFRDQVITLYWSVSDLYSLSPQLVLLLSETAIRRHFSALNDGDKGEGIIILDKDNRPISRIVSDEVSSILAKNGANHVKVNIDGRRMLVSYAISDITGWKFVALQDFSSLVRPLTRAFSLVFAFIGLMFILSLSWSFVSAYFSSKPIHEILRIVGNPDEPSVGGKLSRILVDRVSTLATQNERLRRNIMRTKHFLEQTSVAAIFNGKIDRNIYQSDLPGVEVKILFTDAFYQVGAIQINGFVDGSYDEHVATIPYERSRLIEVLHQFSKYPIYEKGSDTIGVIFSSDKEPIDFAGIHRSLVKHASCEILLGVGRMYSKPSQIHRSAEEAIAALSVTRPGNRIAYYTESTDRTMEYFLAREALKRFERYIGNGEFEEARVSLESLYDSAIRSSLILDSQKRLIVNGIVSCLYNAWNRMQLESETTLDLDVNELLDFNRQANDSTALERIRDVVACLADVGRESRDLQNNHLLAAIVEFIRTSYRNSSLSIDMAAEQIGISSSYLSRFMKTYTNMNFHEYVEALRIHAANELLSNTTLSVKEIADSIGFSSHSSFSRAYRRVQHMSPTEYRKGTPS